MMSSMDETFTAVLERRDLDPSLLPHAMRYFVSAWSQDVPPEQMRDNLLAAGVDSAELSRAEELLSADPALIENAALAILQAGWEDPSNRAVVDGALGAAGAKLPVVEVALIAIVAVYGMWLAATRGRRSQRTVIRRHADGSWEQEQEISWYDASGPLGAIAGLFGASADNAPDEAGAELDDPHQPGLPEPRDG